jgi:hypothetical protein
VRLRGVFLVELVGAEGGDVGLVPAVAERDHVQRDVESPQLLAGVRPARHVIHAAPARPDQVQPRGHRQQPEALQARRDSHPRTHGSAKQPCNLLQCFDPHHTYDETAMCFGSMDHHRYIQFCAEQSTSEQITRCTDVTTNID